MRQPHTCKLIFNRCILLAKCCTAKFCFPNTDQLLLFPLPAISPSALHRKSSKMGPFLSFLCFHPRMQQSASVSSLAFYFLVSGNSVFHIHYWKNYTLAGQKMWFPSHISPFGKDILTYTCVNPKASGASKLQMIITSAFLLWLKRQNSKSPWIHTLRKPGQLLLPKILWDSETG